MAEGHPMGVGDLFLVKKCDPGMLWITFPITCRLLVYCACVLGSEDPFTSHLHHFSFLPQQQEENNFTRAAEFYH